MTARRKRRVRRSARVHRIHYRSDNVHAAHHDKGICGVDVSAPGVYGALPLATKDSSQVTCPSCQQLLAAKTEIALMPPRPASIATATGADLDKLAMLTVGYTRTPGETDAQLRARITHNVFGGVA